MDGEFETAADFQERYVTTLPESAGAEYHRSEKWICKAKNALLTGEYEQARNLIQDVEEKVGFLHSRYRSIELLTEIAVDYRHGNVTDAETVYSDLYDRDADDHLLEIERDYTTALTQILAAQRLRKWPIDQELLDILVNHALRGAFIPKEVDELAPAIVQSSIALNDLSVGQFWRQHLP